MINFHCHQLCPLCWSKENNLPNEQGFVGSLYDQKVAFVADKEGFVGKDHEVALVAEKMMGNMVAACTCLLYNYCIAVLLNCHLI